MDRWAKTLYPKIVVWGIATIPLLVTGKNTCNMQELEVQLQGQILKLRKEKGDSGYNLAIFAKILHINKIFQ